MTWDCIAKVIDVLAVVAAAASAFFAWRSAEATRREAEATRSTMLAQLLMPIREEYASRQMREYITALHRFRERYPDNFEKVFYDSSRTRYVDRQRDKVEFGELREARRAYSHLYVHRIGRLLNAGLVDEQFVEDLVGADELQLLLEVVEPLERALAEAEDRQYNPAGFDVYRRILRRMKQNRG